MPPSYAMGAIPLDPKDAYKHPSIASLQRQIATDLVLPSEPDWTFLAPRPNPEQDGRGICVGEAASSYLHALTKVQSGEDVPPLSGAGIYELACRYDGFGNPRTTDGTAVWAAAQALQHDGAPTARDFPFVPENVGNGIPAGTRITTEYRIDDYHVGYGTAQLEDALRMGPCIATFACEEGYNFPPSDGMITVSGHTGITGYHANTFYGYKTIRGEIHYRVQNWWGTLWGDQGWGWMPRSYFAKWGADITVFVPNLNQKIRGDVNFDSYVNMADVLVTMHLCVHRAQSTEPIRYVLGKANGDGIDVRDAIRLMKQAVGL